MEIRGRQAILSLKKRGELINEEEENIHQVLSFSSFSGTETEYGLVILQDFQQSKFRIDGKEVIIYPFKIDSNSTINIDFNVTIKNNAHEIDYLIIKNPNDVSKGNSLVENLTNEIFTLRHPVKNKKLNKEKFSESILSIIDLKSSLMLASTIEDPKVLLRGSSNQTIYLHIGNEQEIKMDYVAVTFINGRQIPLSGGNLVSFFNVLPSTTNVYELKLPDTNKPVSYQLVLFPGPFNINMKNGAGPDSRFSTSVVIYP
jgi:hypothetical protein